MSTVQELDIQCIADGVCDDIRKGFKNLRKLSTEDQDYLVNTVADVLKLQAYVDDDFDKGSFEPILCYLILKQLGD